MNDQHGHYSMKMPGMKALCCEEASNRIYQSEKIKPDIAKAVDIVRFNKHQATAKFLGLSACSTHLVPEKKAAGRPCATCGFRVYDLTFNG